MKEKDGSKITRRTFIKTTGGVLAAASLGVGMMGKANAQESATETQKVKTIPKRLLGKTGERLSIIGFGGIVVCGVEQSEANAMVREALERGVNYFDVAPTYFNGEAEERLGIALEGVRENVFLACKTEKRKKEDAQKALEESLARLKTDYFDLYQLHAMTSEDDFQQAMGANGAIEAFVEAREKGIVRYLGFSAHSAEIALKLMDSFEFDSVLFPMNWVCTFNANFGPQVIAKAEEKGVGRLALKALARTPWGEGDNREEYPKCWYKPVTDPEEANLAVRFTLSEPITSAIPPGDIRLFRMAMDIVGDKFKPLTESERELLKQKAEALDPIFRLAG